MEKESSKERILVIRYGTIGDTIFASAFYRELRNAKPNAIIDALVDINYKGEMTLEADRFLKDFMVK